MAKLLLISDTHGCLKYDDTKRNILKKQDPDAVFCMGDLFLDELLMIKAWFMQRSIPVYGIPGNHEPKRYINEAGLINLHGKSCEIAGFRIAGFGGSIRYKQNNDLCMMTDEESVSFAKTIPQADVLISHSPYKIKTNDITHSGLEGISWYLEKHAPLYHFYGHLHQKDSFFVLKNKTKSACVYQCAIYDGSINAFLILF